nr:zinc finger protein ZIC 5-like [Equus caballus]
MSICSQLHANPAEPPAGPPRTRLSIRSSGRGSTPTRVLPAGRPESPERGSGATLGSRGTGMLSRPAGLVSLGSQPRTPPPPAPHGRPEKRTFYPSLPSAPSFVSFAPCLSPSTSRPSGSGDINLKKISCLPRKEGLDERGWKEACLTCRRRKRSQLQTIIVMSRLGGEAGEPAPVWSAPECAERKGWTLDVALQRGQLT